MKRRVVITGLGAITPIGNNVDSFWEGVKLGKNGIDEISLFNAENLKVKMAAEVKDFDPNNFIDKKEAKRMDRYTQFAIIAAQESIKDSNLDFNTLYPNGGFDSIIAVKLLCLFIISVFISLFVSISDINFSKSAIIFKILSIFSYSFL